MNGRAHRCHSGRDANFDSSCVAAIAFMADVFSVFTAALFEIESFVFLSTRKGQRCLYRPALIGSRHSERKLPSSRPAREFAAKSALARAARATRLQHSLPPTSLCIQ